MIDTAREDPSAIFLAEDEAWMYLQATTLPVWAVRGQTAVVRVDPGRTKVGFYGTINLHTGEGLVTRSTELNNTMTAQHLQEILDHHPTRRIVLLWDRAKWHRGPAIRKLVAENPRLQLIEFPTAAPDLNPQEQVWKKLVELSAIITFSQNCLSWPIVSNNTCAPINSQAPSWSVMVITLFVHF